MRCVAISVVLLLVAVSMGTGCAACLGAPSQTHHCCSPSGCKAPKTPASAACSTPAPVFAAIENRVVIPVTVALSGPVVPLVSTVPVETRVRVEPRGGEYSPPTLYLLNSVLNV